MTETELKFCVLGSLTPEDVESVALPGCQLANRSNHAILDTLLDTNDGRIVSSGRSFRVRQDGANTYVTLKGPGQHGGHLQQREEIEVQISGGEAEAQQWPEEITQALGFEDRTSRFEPLLQIENSRVTWDVLRDGSLLAEVALDRGHFVAGALREPFHELEIEAKGDGTIAEIEAVADCFLKALPLAPESRSKQRQGLAVRHRSMYQEREPPST